MNLRTYIWNDSSTSCHTNREKDLQSTAGVVDNVQHITSLDPNDTKRCNSAENREPDGNPEIGYGMSYSPQRQFLSDEADITMSQTSNPHDLFFNDLQSERDQNSTSCQSSHVLSSTLENPSSGSKQSLTGTHSQVNETQNFPIRQPLKQGMKRVCAAPDTEILSYQLQVKRNKRQPKRAYLYVYSTCVGTAGIIEDTSS